MAALDPAYDAVLLAAVLVMAGVAAFAWRRQDEPGAWFVVGYATGGVLWSVGGVATSLASSFPTKATWFHLLFVGVIVTVPTWFLFVLVYTGRWRLVTPKSIVLVNAVPAAAILLTLTNPLHGLVFAELFPISSGAGLDIVPGAAFYPWAAYSLVLLISSVVLLVDASVRAQGLFRLQIAFLLVGTLAPAVGSLVRVVGVVPVDLTPLGVAVAGSALTVAFSRTGFLDVTPVAGSAVMDTIDAAVFVVDRRDRLVEANPQAVRMLQAEAGPIGQQMTELLEDSPLALKRYEEILEEGATESDLTLGERHYRVTASPLSDYMDRVLGHVFLVTDVTDQRRRERELTRQNERLDEFAAIVSHDLRNPLNVARGRLSMAMERGEDTDVETAAEAVGRMETIVEDVLTIARQGQTVGESAREPTSLRAVTEAAWASVQSGEARLVVESDSVVSADPNRLQRALENLFRNAVVHGVSADAEATDPISVRVGALDPTDQDASGAGFFVEDDGRGIPDAERDHIVESGYSTEPDGTGFGLAIVSSIVEAHDWSLSVSESAEGGARFEVRGPGIDAQ